MVVLQEFKSALLRGLNDRIKHQFRVRLGVVFSNFVGVVLMEQVFVPVAESDETGNPFMFSMVSNNLLDDCISVLLIQFAKSLEPVMHFEEVIDYRVGQVVLHSTQ